MPIGLVALVADVAQDVSPGDAIGTPHHPRVGDGAEGLADVRCVGDVAVSREKNGSEAGGVCCVTDVGLGRGRDT